MTSQGSNKPQILFELIEEGFLPTAAKQGDAGHDVKACIRKDDSNQELAQVQRRMFHFLNMTQRDPSLWEKMPSTCVDGKYLNANELEKENYNLLEKLEAGELLLLVPPSWHEIEKEIFGLCPSSGNTHLGLPNWFPIPLGFKVALPSDSSLEPFVYVMDIVSRSGIGTKYGLVIKQGVGTVDSGYRDEVKAPLENRGNYLQFISKGCRIAQAKFYSCLSLSTYQSTELITDNLPDSDRGTGGFGHSGT